MMTHNSPWEFRSTSGIVTSFVLTGLADLKTPPDKMKFNAGAYRCLSVFLDSVLHIELLRAIFAKIWDGWLFGLSDDDLGF